MNISISKVKLVREPAHRYDVEKQISSPDSAVKVINAVLDLEDEAQEVLGVLFLDTKNKVTGITEVTRGSLNTSIVHPREVFKAAILHNAASIILFHNHPSGDSAPSNEDRAVTKRIKETGKILDIPLLDHIVIGNGEHYSFANRGIL